MHDEFSALSRFVLVQVPARHIYAEKHEAAALMVRRWASDAARDQARQRKPLAGSGSGHRRGGANQTGLCQQLGSHLDARGPFKWARVYTLCYYILSNDGPCGQDQWQLAERGRNEKVRRDGRHRGKLRIGAVSQGSTL